MHVTVDPHSAEGHVLAVDAPWPWSALGSRAPVGRRHPQPGTCSFLDALELEASDFDRTWGSVHEAWSNASTPEGFDYGYRRLDSDEALALVLVPAYLEQLVDAAEAFEEARRLSERQEIVLRNGERYGDRLRIGDAGLLAAFCTGAAVGYERGRETLVSLIAALEDAGYDLESFLELTRGTFEDLRDVPFRCSVPPSAQPLEGAGFSTFLAWGAGLWLREELMRMGVSLIGSPGDEGPGARMLEDFRALGWLGAEAQGTLALYAPIGRFSPDWFRRSGSR